MLYILYFWYIIGIFLISYFLFKYCVLEKIKIMRFSRIYPFFGF